MSVLEHVCISVGFIVQELGRNHNRTYKAHPLDLTTDVFLPRLQRLTDTSNKPVHLSKQRERGGRDESYMMNTIEQMTDMNL